MQRNFNCRGLMNTGLTAALTAAIAGTAVAAPTISIVQPLPGDLTIDLRAISSDGSVVVGNSTGGAGTRGAVWSPMGGTAVLSAGAGRTVVKVVDMAGSGTKFVGRVVESGVERPLVWTTGGATIVELPLPPEPADINGVGPSDPQVAAISSDGSTVIGTYVGTSGVTGQRMPWGVKWDMAGNTTVLRGPQSNYRSTSPALIGGNDSMIVGEGLRGNDGWFNLYWSGSTPNHMFGSQPWLLPLNKAVSDTGVVVGWLQEQSAFGYRKGAYRWTPAGGYTFLGNVPLILPQYPDGLTGSATACNADASLIMGSGSWDKQVLNTAFTPPLPMTITTYVPFVWTASTGVLVLTDALANVGTDLTGWTLEHIKGMSSDGRTVYGTGQYDGVTRSFVITNFSLDGLVVGAACTLSDVAGPNQSVGHDSALTADDIIVYLGWFFAHDARANVAGPNQSTTPDNQFTADDVIVFLSRYFAGC